MAIVSGWGRGTFGQLTFGEPIPVPVTGLVGTSALDNGTAVQAAAVTGVSAVASTLSVGDETVTGTANVPITLGAATSALGVVNNKAVELAKAPLLTPVVLVPLNVMSPSCETT